jgi:hypothetical protein
VLLDDDEPAPGHAEIPLVASQDLRPARIPSGRLKERLEGLPVVEQELFRAPSLLLLDLVGEVLPVRLGREEQLVPAAPMGTGRTA